MERKIPRKRVARAVGLTCRDDPESSQVAAGTEASVLLCQKEEGSRTGTPEASAAQREGPS